VTDRRPSPRAMSTKIEESIAAALDNKVSKGILSKRVHVERALLSYLEPEDFDSPEDRERLIKKYGLS
jgi:hypothetical protein